MIKLCERIKYFRQTKGWSQEYVASCLAISTNAYGCIERGTTEVTYTRLEQIAQLFEIDLPELLGLGKSNFYNSNRDNVTYYQNSPVNTELGHELEKKELLLAERDKEIQHLNEIINLLKKT
jgi:transcriptional regulator with XRE-family HTH domain